MTLKRREGGGSIQTPPIKWKFSVDTPYKNIRFSRPPYTIFGFSRPPYKNIGFSRTPIQTYNWIWFSRPPYKMFSSRNVHPPRTKLSPRDPHTSIIWPLQCLSIFYKKTIFSAKTVFWGKKPFLQNCLLVTPLLHKVRPLATFIETHYKNIDIRDPTYEMDLPMLPSPLTKLYLHPPALGKALE